MRGHIINSRALFKEHWQWMKSHGITPSKKIANGNYPPFTELVEKECKLKD
jgi:predicted double-glycine peptidase